jgi:hypothetical protein
MEKGKTTLQRLLGLIGPVCVLLVLWFLLSSTSRLETSQGEERQKQLETAIHRAVMTCYTVEGVYPPTIEYIEEYYGIQIDREQYAVFYDIFADNLMPDITVVPLY